jgi:hypothetical protein
MEWAFHTRPFLDVLHALVWEKYTLRARPCLLVAFFIRPVGARQLPGLPSEAKWTQGFVLKGIPLGASTQGFAPSGPYPRWVGNPWASTILALGTPGLPREAWPPTGLGHLRGLRPLGTAPANASHVCFHTVFNTEAFPQHACSLGPGPLHLLLQGFCPPAFLSCAWTTRAFRIHWIAVAGLRHPWPSTMTD